MAREHWPDHRSYRDFDMYSFHIDPALYDAACYGGSARRTYSGPKRIYHIEHSV